MSSRDRPLLGSDVGLLFYGEPLIAEAGYSFICLMCKCMLSDEQKLAQHVDGDLHRARAINAMAAGALCQPITHQDVRFECLRYIKTCVENAFVRTPEFMVACISACQSRIAKSIVQSPTLNLIVLRLFAPQWPKGEPQPPRRPQETSDGTEWSAMARGCEVRDAPGKGKGVFALRPLPRGHVVGVYLGEPLSQRAKNLRHGTKYGSGDTVHDLLWPEGTVRPDDMTADLSDPPVASAAADVKAAEEERCERLGRLSRDDGAPIGGANNYGSYVFTLLPGTVLFDETRVAYLDAEDPNLSSWVRYINNAPYGSEACNCCARVDGLRQRVWIETRRRVEADEELSFFYRGSSQDVGWLQRLVVGVGERLRGVS